MARFLAIDWEQQQLHIVAGAAVRDGMRVEQALSWTLPEALTPETGEALGKTLREALRAADVAPAAVLACVGRERVVLKELRYPPVPDADEPALVRFQAAKELSEPTDEVIIDYTHLGDPAAPGERQALAVAVRKEVVHAVQALCRGLGMKLLAVTPRPAAVFGALERCRPINLATNRVEALLTVGSRWADLGILRGKTLLFARSLAVGPSLVGDVKRSLAVFAAGAEAPVQELHVATQGDPAPLCAALKDALAIPVQPLDPFLPEEENIRLDAAKRGSFTAAVGLLHRWAQRAELAINFIAPKEPRPAVNPRQRQAVVYGIAAAVVVLLLIVIGNRVLASRKAAIRDLKEERADLELKVKNLAQDKADSDAFKEWKGGKISWVDEIYDLTARFPAAKGFRLESVTVTTNPPSKKNAKEAVVATMQFKGVAPLESSNLVYQLVGELNNDPHLRAKVLNTKQGSTGHEFHVTVEVHAQAPADYVTVLKAAPKRAVPMPAEDDADMEGDIP